MQNLIDNQTKKIIDNLQRNSNPKEHVYLVGGIVRDLLMRRSIHDFDISFHGEVSAFAKRIADDLGASYFMLNEKFQTARILYKHGPDISIDIVGMRGNSIEEDLRLRDFTINAMALDLQFPDQLIDPLNGADDLNKRILRVCSESSFSDDPVRILRAIRQSIIFNLRIDTTTLQLLKQSLSGLNKVTSERIRDELMRILDPPDPTVAINILERLKILDLILPEVNSDGLKLVTKPNSNMNLWENTVQTIKNLTSIEHLLVNDVVVEDLNNLRGAEISLKLGRFREQFKDIFKKSFQKDRSIHSLLTYSCLFKNISTPELGTPSNSFPGDIKPEKFFGSFNQRSKKFALSNKEIKWCISVLTGQHLFHEMGLHENVVDGKDVYRYFQICGESGVLGCLLALADTLTLQYVRGFDVIWNRELQLARTILEGYWEKNQEWVNPPIFINGNELLSSFPGLNRNQIGEWLEKVKQATAAGIIKNKYDAKNYLEESIPNSYKKNIK